MLSVIHASLVLKTGWANFGRLVGGNPEAKTIVIKRLKICTLTRLI